MQKIAIFASHNGSGFDAIYEAILSKKLNAEIVFILSNNTNAPVLTKAKNHHIEHFVVNNKTDKNPDKQIFSLLKHYNCSYIFLSGYMKMVSADITKNFTVINSHPSLLPKYGGYGMYGRKVHEAVVENKEVKSGITIHKVNEIYDDGEIILQKELVLNKDESAITLEKRLKIIEKIAIVEGLNKCLK